MFLLSPIDGHLNYFQFWAMMNNVTMTIHIHVLSLCGYVFTKNHNNLSPLKIGFFSKCHNSIGMAKTHRKQ